MPQDSNPIAPLICSQCHQPVLSGYYFCPNCGKELHAAPLATTLSAQVWLYAFSIILPFICFIAVTKWKGLLYYRSHDPKAKSMGTVAWALLILSTIALCWFTYVWTQEMIQSTVNSINADFSI
jgi:hypothetical protein